MTRSFAIISMSPHISLCNHHSWPLTWNYISLSFILRLLSSKKPGDLPPYLKSSRVGGGGRMKEGQRGELCSNEARQPPSASAIRACRRSEGAARAPQIVESSGSGETNDDPECVEWRLGERLKKNTCISMAFDPI